MLFLKQEKKELVLILDVQSSMVRGSLTLMDPSDPPHVIFSYNAPIPWKSKTDDTYLIKMTLRAVSETVEAARRFVHLAREKHAIPRHISSIHFALSSPWIMSEAKQVKEDYEKAVLVTQTTVDKLVSDDKASPALKEGIVLLDKKIFSVRLNGYETAQWANQTAKSLEVSYALSMAGKNILDRFSEACGKGNHQVKIFFHSSLILQYIGLKGAMIDLSSYVLFHIHGEITEIAVVENGACLSFELFPFGVRTLVRKISHSTGTDIQTADSLVTLYTGGHYDDIHGKSDLESISNIRKGWAIDARKCVDKAGLVRPSKILISSLAHDDFFKTVISTEYPTASVELISIENITPHVIFDARSERRRLTGLYALAIHIMNYH